MNKKLINLKLLTDEFGGLELGEGEPGGFNKRLILQKRVYLLQQMGLNSGFRFSWYLRGPYSPELTECAFGLKGDKEIQTIAAGYQFKEDATRKIEQLKEIEQSIDGLNNSNRHIWLELLASIHFLRFRAFVPGGVNKENISRALSARGKNFNPQMIKQGWNLVSRIVGQDQMSNS